MTVTPSKAFYEEGEVVELMPKPETGYCFTGWSGDVRDESLVVKLTMDGDKAITARFASWRPPVGIPAPEFGIFETYRMYDLPANRNPALTYTQNAEGGSYTHYIDNTHPNATDTSNPYGTASTPRRTVPENLPAGSVVEVHGGPYDYMSPSGGYGWRWFSGTGTRESPIFIRGTEGQIPRFGKVDIRVGGSYMIIENLELQDSRFNFHNDYPPHVYEHIALRNVEIHSYARTSGALIAFGSAYYVMHDIVVYNNHIHHNGNVPEGQDTDVIGVMVGEKVERAWIVDNHIHHNDGDSVQLNAAGGMWAQNNEWPKYVYIGRNIMHEDRENAVDLKDCEHVIISQNEVYGYTENDRVFGIVPTPRPIHSGLPTALITANEGTRLTWTLFNDIHDCGRAIRVSDEYVNTLNYILGNRLYNLSREAVISWRDAEVYLVNNVIYNVGRGFWGAESGNADAAYYVFVNNIFARINGYTVDGEVRPDDYISIERGLPADRAVVANNVFYQGGGITWGDSNADVYDSIAAFIAGEPGKGSGCVEADPLFAAAAQGDFRVQAASPAIDAGIEFEVYQRFYDLYGIDIRCDLQGRTRPAGPAWDIGGYEYALDAITNLSVSGTSANAVTLAWTVPGEEAVTGPPASYEIRYSDVPLTAANWEAATPVPGEPVPGPFGQPQSFTVTGLEPGATYYFAIKIGDEVGHFSELSNVVSATTASSGNCAPVLVGIGDRSVVEGGTLEFVVNATDADVGDQLSYAAVGLPGGAGFDPATRRFTWTTTVTQEGIYRVMFQVSDGQVTVAETITITVLSGSNHPPVLNPIGDKNVNENETLTFSVSATDPDGDQLTYSASNLPSGASFVGQTFTWTPAFDQAGSYNVTFTASDGLAQDSETITITVVNVNRAPVLAAIGDKQVNENFSLSFPIGATDPDGDSLSYSATGLPSGANFAGGVFSWIPSFAQAGSYSVTFTVSDGGLSNTEQVTVTVANVSDETGPTVVSLFPPADAIQVPVNPLIALTVSDGGWGVDANVVTIEVDGQLIYSGNQAEQQSPYGICRRTGAKASYRYYFHPARFFNYEQEVSIRVMASDLANNVMPPYAYEFVTAMRVFGRNERVSLSGGGSYPAVATDSGGNLWAVWQAGPADARDIFAKCRSSQTGQWSDLNPFQLTSGDSDQCCPVAAVDANDTVYVAWQDYRRGDWDIYLSWSTDDGATWQPAVRVTDSNDNQTSPALVMDSAIPACMYVAWEDDGAGNQEIYVASSTTRFAGKSITRVTSQATDQTGPVMAVGGDNTVYLLWTDQRSGTADVYGASSASGWANVPIATGAGHQQDPATAVSPGTSQLHLLWVDNAAGNRDVVYATSVGLPAGPLPGTVLVDDDTGADQFAPRLTAVRDQAGDSHVYACWQDHRWVADAGDSELYFVEIGSGAGTTNVLMRDGGANSNQSEPVLGYDGNGQPVILWTDDRDGSSQVYATYSTYFAPTVLASGLISSTTGGRVGEDPAAVDDEGDVSIQIPANAFDCDMMFNISQVQNPPDFGALYLATYEIGPSGVQFSFPATVTIPYTASGSGRPIPYWYDAQTGTLSQQGITDIVNRDLGNGLSAISFNTTHLTSFCVLDEPADGGNGGGSGGGGGCAMSRSHEGRIGEYIVPYVALILGFFFFNLRDRRHRGV